MKSLILSDLDACKNAEYICALLECENLNLEISGIDFKSENAINKVKERLEKDDRLMQDLILNKFNENDKKFAKMLEDRAKFIENHVNK